MLFLQRMGLKRSKRLFDSAFEKYVAEADTSIYCIGSIVGPHPFPLMVRDFQSVIGFKSKEQIEGKLPDNVVACIDRC